MSCFLNFIQILSYLTIFIIIAICMWRVGKDKDPYSVLHISICVLLIALIALTHNRGMKIETPLVKVSLDSENIKTLDDLEESIKKKDFAKAEEEFSKFKTLLINKSIAPGIGYGLSKEMKLEDYMILRNKNIENASKAESMFE